MHWELMQKFTANSLTLLSDVSVEIHAKQLKGAWDDGYSLDAHTIESAYIGDNEFGRPMF
jgi:hypothetical protein